MVDNTILLILIGILGLALAFSWWQIWQMKRAYQIFFNTKDPKNLQKQLNDYAKAVDESLQKLDQMATFTAGLHKRNQLAISKLGLVRFNPFNDTGGNQSFCLALLDSHNSGLVISSIHARTGTRFYAKQIISGKPTNQLSEEEEAAYKHALTGTGEKTVAEPSK